MLVLVYTCQNATLLEITSRLNLILFEPKIRELHMYI